MKKIIEKSSKKKVRRNNTVIITKTKIKDEFHKKSIRLAHLEIKSSLKTNRHSRNASQVSSMRTMILKESANHSINVKLHRIISRNLMNKTTQIGRAHV